VQDTVFVNSFTDADAGTQPHLLFFGQSRVSFPEGALNIDRAKNRIDRARALDHETVAGTAKYAAVVLMNDVVNYLATGAQYRNRPLIILRNQSAISDHIGREKGRNTSLVCCHHVETRLSPQDVGKRCALSPNSDIADRGLYKSSIVPIREEA
jgi:hypothetical protein